VRKELERIIRCLSRAIEELEGAEEFLHSPEEVGLILDTAKKEVHLGKKLLEELLKKVA